MPTVNQRINRGINLRTPAVYRLLQGILFLVTITSVAGELAFDGGSGNDTVSVGTAMENATITLGDGANYADVHEAQKDLKVTGGDGNDSVWVSSIIGSGDINLGNGDNDVTIDEVAEKDLNITGGDGWEDIVIDSVLGALTIDDALGKAEITGGAGADTFDVCNGTALVVNGDAVISTGDGADVVRMGDVKDGGLTLDVGAGADSINTSIIEKDAVISLGDGADHISLGGPMGGNLKRRCGLQRH